VQDQQHNAAFPPEESALPWLALVSAPEAESGWVNRGEPRRSSCRLSDTVALRVESQESMVMGDGVSKS